MLIFLTGPTGSGKTDAAWGLIELSPPMVFLDCDWFAARTPFSWSRQDDVETVFEVLATVMQFHLHQNPFTNLVVTLTLEMALTSEAIQRHFANVGQPMSWFCLTASQPVLHSRIAGRDRSHAQKRQESAALPGQRRQCLALPKWFIEVDTSSQTEIEVATRILALAADFAFSWVGDRRP